MGQPLETETEHGLEARIEEVMRERMARVLCLFRVRGLRYLVLGSFGTGAFGCVRRWLIYCFVGFILVLQE
jgi:hypothetical protein